HGASSVFREAANHSPPASLYGLCHAALGRSYAFRWRTSHCDSARPSKTASCPRADTAGRPGLDIVPNASSLPLTFRCSLRSGTRTFVLLKYRFLLPGAPDVSKAGPATWPLVSHSSLLRRATPIVRNGRSVLDVADLQPGCRESTHRRFTA